ncbi:MAG TPA: hypothetical protein VJC01_00905 [Candidatus Paceibacterota bacterium]
MKKSTLLLILIIISNLVLFVGIMWPLFKLPSGQLPVIGPLYNTLSSDIVDAILIIFIAILMLILNGLLAILISVKLKNLMINTSLISKIYFAFSIIINIPFFIAVLLRILISPPAGILNLTYTLAVLTFFTIPFFSTILLFWGLWIWFWLKIRSRPVFIGTLLNTIVLLITLLFLGVALYKSLTEPKCNPETGENCVITNPL